jgi:hypothetical protein
MVVVGSDGDVLFKSRIGPRSTNADQLREWLASLK